MPQQLTDRQQGSEMRPVDLRDAIIARLMKDHGIESVVFDSFSLENGPRAKIDPAEVTRDTPVKSYTVGL
jgi:predicted nucleic acid-binding protein